MGAYLLSELFRNINSTIGPVLQQEFALDAATLGLMTSLFLFAVAGSQIFTGILLDRLGARRTVAMLLIIAAIGAMLFAAGNFTTLLVGRLLIGIGMSGCWTAAFKVNADWWPKDRLALANGAIIGLAGLGSLAATLPTRLLLDIMPWNDLFVWLAALTVGMAVILFTLVPENREKTNTASADRFNLLTELQGFGLIMKNPVIIAFAPMSIIRQGAWLSYQGLWAGIWLRDVTGLAPTPVATSLLFLAICIVIGNLCLGLVADILIRLRVSLFRSMFLACCLYILAQILIIFLPASAATGLWMLFGFFLAGPIFAYALISQAVPATHSGRAVSLLNLFATLAGFLMQYGVGAVVNQWVAIDGIYPATAHITALVAVICVQLAALVWWLLRRGPLNQAVRDMGSA